MELKDYNPKIHEGRYVEMIIESSHCACCKSIMIKRLPYGSIFPKYIRLNQEAQAAKAGVRFESDKIKIADESFCEVCEKEGKIKFKCELCGEMKPTDKIQESIGYPADYLCSDCYKTTPAIKWDEKVDKLQDEHRYDYE